MNRKTLWIVLMLCLLGRAGLSAPTPALPLQLQWPPLEGFHHETIPFPLDFAPTLAYSGYEELRFAPGFSKPDAPDYFTYSFIWAVKKPVTVDQATLKTDLTAYFRGLMDAVAKEKQSATGHFDTTVAVVPHRAGFVAKVSTWDAFSTGQALHLTMYVSQLPCAVPGYSLYYFEASPHMESSLVQGLLRQVRDSFKEASN